MWVWLDCDKHNQLRDLVATWQTAEDQEEYIKCGCRYKAADEGLELARLRGYEADRNSKMAAMWADALAPKPSPPFEWPWWTLYLGMMMVGLALLLVSIMIR